MRLVSLIENMATKKNVLKRRKVCVWHLVYAVYARAATSNSLKALSHSFCPAACWVQSVISWLILSVTALKHTRPHVCPPHAATAWLLSHMMQALLFKHGTAGLSNETGQRGSAEIEWSLCSALSSTDRP